MSWYRTYRPQQLRELHLQTVRESLQRLLTVPTFPHALLFAGPKGTGKTSSARILAALLNDPVNKELVEVRVGGKVAKSTPSSTKKVGEKAASLPTLQEPNPENELVQRIYAGSSLCVTELDAASYRGIDDIRELRERLYLAPQEGMVSVYILDEVHMFTTEAWNALLKVLEEPPAHVVFVLATTELGKVPDTIQSRCQVVQFHVASEVELRQALLPIMTAEGIECEDGVLELIIGRSQGSFRDAVKWAETVCQGKSRVTLAEAQTILGTTKLSPDEVIHRVVQKDAAGVAAFFQELRTIGADEVLFYEGVVEFLHQTMMQHLVKCQPQSSGDKSAKSSSAISAEAALFLLHEVATVDPRQVSPVAHLGLEVCLLNVVFRAQKGKGGAPSSNTASSSTPSSVTGSGTSKKDARSTQPGTEVISASVSATKKIDEVAASSEPPEPVHQEKQRNEPAAPLTAVTPAIANAPASTTTGTQDDWQAFVRLVTREQQSLGMLLQTCRWLGETGDTISLESPYSFHQEQLHQPRVQKSFEELATAHFGQIKRLVVTVQEVASTATASSEQNQGTSSPLALVAAEALIG